MQGTYNYIPDTNHVSRMYSSDSQPGFRGTLGYRGNFLGVPRDVEITNILWWKYSEENNLRECVEKLRLRTPK